MAEKVPQTLANHARIDPVYHFFLAPLAFGLFIWSIIHLVRHSTTEAAMLLGFAILAMASVVTIRGYSLKVQDRVIRLEERLRLQSLLGGGAEIPELTKGQWVALRFACDKELPSLVGKAAANKLSSKQIKQAIQTWRADYFRV